MDSINLDLITSTIEFSETPLLTSSFFQFKTYTVLLDWLGIVIFALTGALVASKKEMDIVGFILLAVVTGIGGGTMRDVITDQSVFWVQTPAYLMTCASVAVATFFVAHHLRLLADVISFLDAIGMALFSVTGAEKALIVTGDPFVAASMGVMTATFGGIIRDIMGGESPKILMQEVYVSAALGGALIFVFLSGLGLECELALSIGFAFALLVRLVAIRKKWSLPRYGSRYQSRRSRLNNE